MFSSPYVKDFDKWNNVKKKVDEENNSSIFRVGEIRWVVLGVNIGSEIDGKGDSFNRPCLIVDSFSDKLVLVFPMSTKLKKTAGYVEITLPDGRQVSVCIHQAKTISPKRILKRITSISTDKLQGLKNKYKEFYHLN
jgi:mRNA interferase MazF